MPTPAALLLVIVLVLSHVACAARNDKPADASTTESVRITRMTRPTASIGRRAVSLSTIGPASLFIPQLAGDLTSKEDGETRIYYLGMGYHTQTSVYALVTGSADSEKTAYLYHASTEAYLPNLQRTVTLENGTTLSGKFNVGCAYKNGMGSDGTCTMMYEPSAKATVEYTTSSLEVNPVTTFTAVRGQLQADIAKTATTPSAHRGSSATSSARGMWPDWANTGFVLTVCIIGAGAVFL